MSHGLLAVSLLLACGSPAAAADRRAVEAAREKIDINFFLLLKDEDKTSSAEIALGKQLFFDPRLSGDGTISCATCHKPEMAWADGLPRSRGVGQHELKRNTPSMLTTHYAQGRFFWDGRARSIEEALLAALQSPVEMNRDLRGLVVELDRIPDYVRQFVELYGRSGVTPDHAARAIAAFIKSEARALPTAFDRSRLDPTALSEAAQRGLILFAGKGDCVKCHVGPGFSDALFHNIGLKIVPGTENDMGRYAIVPREPFRRAFRTPSLLHVAYTAPYMHDGSLATLREVVDFYDRGGDATNPANNDMSLRPLGLTVDEKSSLIAFMEALSAPAKPVTAPVLPAAKPRSLVAAVAATRAAALVVSTRAPVSAEAPAASGRLAVADSALDAAQGLVTKLTGGERAVCARRVSPGELVLAIGRGDFTRDQEAALRQTIQYDLIAYYQYRAFAEDNLALCDELHSFDQRSSGLERSGPDSCRGNALDLAAARSMMTHSPDLERVCRQNLAHAYGDRISTESAAGICGTIAAKLEDPKAVCASLSPRYLPPEAVKACENDLMTYTSDVAPSRARDEIPSHLLRRYLAFDLFKRARRAGDPKLCRDSEFCRVLMGEGQALAAELAAKTATRACVEVRAASQGAAAEVEELLSAAGNSLAQERSGGATGLDTRERRLDRLRDTLRDARSR